MIKSVEQTRIEVAIQNAWRHVGVVPYKWGGDDPFAGYDCSGFAQEIMASVGMDKKGDETAQMLHDRLLNEGIATACVAGAFSFYGRSHDKIIHVGFCIDDMHMIEAGGGGSRTNTIEDAIKHNALVRVRPTRQRRDFLTCLMPDYNF